MQDEPIADNVCIRAEASRPQAVTQHRRSVTPGNVFLWQQRATSHCRRPQGLKESVRHERGRQSLWVAITREIQPGHPLRKEVTTDGLGSRAFTAPVEEIRLGHGPMFRATHMVDIPHAHDAIGFWEGKRLEQHPTNDAEDRGICPDAERQREQRGGGESRRRAQRAQRVLQVLFQLIENRHTSFLPFAAQVLVTTVAARKLQVAKAAFRLELCLARGPTLFAQFLCRLLYMKAQLFVDVGCDLTLRAPREAKERASAGRSIVAHVGCSTLKRASTYRRSSATSAESCLRPSRVM